MKLEMYRPVDRDESVYTLTIPGGDLSRARLTHLDRALLADCNGPDATIADRLLALEMLARRIQEAVPDLGKSISWERPA